MIQYPVRFDSGPKQFLGTRVPDNASQNANVEAVLDAAFNHPNTPPFIAKETHSTTDDRKSHACLRTSGRCGIREQREWCARRHEGDLEGYLSR
ncbi:DUF1800 family protein [Caulobacter segnis]